MLCAQKGKGTSGKGGNPTKGPGKPHPPKGPKK